MYSYKLCMSRDKFYIISQNKSHTYKNVSFWLCNWESFTLLLVKTSQLETMSTTCEEMPPKMELANTYMLIFHSPVVPTIIQKGFSEHLGHGHREFWTLWIMSCNTANGMEKGRGKSLKIITLWLWYKQHAVCFNNIYSFTLSFEFSLLWKRSVQSGIKEYVLVFCLKLTWI